MAALPTPAVFASANPEPQQQASTATIVGTVLDENNEPIIGASVVPAGRTGSAVATDVYGHFKLRVNPGTKLNVSYVGYQTATVDAADGMTVYMQPTTEMLNELVAVGYGSQKRANLTGAVSTVDVARVMDSRPVADVTRALQGAVPGLTITTSSGDISANPSINIRGVGTLSNDHTSNPLIVVDGVPVEDMSFLNPEDIEEISVLKDAASSSIYGTRAAFGVILITTKTANKKDRVSISYNNNFSWSQPTVLPDKNTTVDDLIMDIANTNPGAEKGGFGMIPTDMLPFAVAWQQQHGGKKYTDMVELKPYVNKDDVGDIFFFKKGDLNPFTGEVMQSTKAFCFADWDIRKTMYQWAPGQKHNVSLEGASGKTHYRVSFGYDSREGLDKYNPNKMARYMANASIDTQVFKFLKAGARFSFSRKEFTSPSDARNQYTYMWRFPSWFEMYGYMYNDEDEKVLFNNDIAQRVYSYNDKTVTDQTRMQAWMQANITKDILLQADFTYDTRQQDSDGTGVNFYRYNQWSAGTDYYPYLPIYSQSGTYASQSHYYDNTWTANVFATYSHTWDNDYNFKAMAGWTAEQEVYKYFYAKRNGLVDESLPNINLTNSSTYSTSGENTHRATTGFFARVNFDYKGKYLLELNGRYDGSSRFPANDQWAFFPSGSVGYRFSEENYFQPLKNWWSNGKIRASYGAIGNEAVGSNRFLSTVTQLGSTYVNWLANGSNLMSMYGMPTLVSSTLTWERIETLDIGLDLGFLDNSLNVVFDWYSRATKDMLGPGTELPSVLGAATPYGNYGSLRTNGWELSINWNHSFGDADVYATFNIGDARTKITKWNNESHLMYSYLPASGNYTEGMYFGDILGFETDGYYTQDDMSWNGKRYVPNEGVVNQTALENGDFRFAPGDVKFVDQNGDGKIDWGKGTVEDHGDLKVIGNAMPRYEYSFRIGGAWKGFDIDIFFQGVGQRKMWATGSTILPQAQSGWGTFTNQIGNYNEIAYLPDGQIDFANSNISEDNWYPRLYSGSASVGTVPNVGYGNFNFYPQSKYLLNLAYLRLKNITVGYTLPAEITQKALIQKARIYFSADNLCFLYNGASKYQLDPELTRRSGSSVVGANTDARFGQTIPQRQALSFGLQVTF